MKAISKKMKIYCQLGKCTGTKFRERITDSSAVSICANDNIHKLDFIYNIEGYVYGIYVVKLGIWNFRVRKSSYASWRHKTELSQLWRHN